MDRYKVSYLIRHMDEKNCGLLVDRSVTFKSFHEALGFIKKLRTTKDLIGSPMMEQV